MILIMLDLVKSGKSLDLVKSVFYVKSNLISINRYFYQLRQNCGISTRLSSYLNSLWKILTPFYIGPCLYLTIPLSFQGDESLN